MTPAGYATSRAVGLRRSLIGLAIPMASEPNLPRPPDASTTRAPASAIWARNTVLTPDRDVAQSWMRLGHGTIDRRIFGWGSVERAV